MTKKRVELLAPAGNYQALVGAVNAGADAVYLGGSMFNARAYADNFTEEEIIKALRYTHINGKKVYLTLNTLIKEKEFSLIYDYIRPFYEAGLDGIIIQDLGVWECVREVFPDLPLHASTQMTITSALGASLLKDAGAERIVPARELSLNEIKHIKEVTGLEIECFIHGAMCYCYSGQCLFSSILGGRSGNRGRCAQPCRLPYKVQVFNNVSEEIYPLSLKDMCTVEYIPQLIEAGIDSFKIEGRMKKPEYAAGVTSVYRKYIDSYYEKGADSYYVEQADMDKLRKLYIRSEVQTGYYERYNGREMVTIGKGGYLGSDETLLQNISHKYLQEEKKLPVNISGTFFAGEQAFLEIEGGGIKQSFYGETVQEALKRPMSKEDIVKQLNKTGNFHIDIVSEDIKNGENIFIPNIRLNELRRNAVIEFEDKVTEAKGLTNRRIMQQNLQKLSTDSLHISTNIDEKNEKVNEKAIKNDIFDAPVDLLAQSIFKGIKLHVNVQNLEQLRIACQYPCDRIYIDSDLYLKEFDQISQCLKKRPDFAAFLSLPFVIRQKDSTYFDELKVLLDEKIKGFLVRNMESLYWVLALETKDTKYKVVTDSGLYCFNAHAAEFLSKYADELYIPWEMNAKEAVHLNDRLKNRNYRLSIPVYGTIPMMITANCVKKTVNSCSCKSYNNLYNQNDTAYLIDRYNTSFPVLCNCEHCYNIIYNSLPYSLHNERESIQRLKPYAVRLDFVFESPGQVIGILDYYTGKNNFFPVNEYTAGHYKRGIE